MHELFFISFSLGRVFFFDSAAPHKFSNDSSLSKIKMTGMLLNVGHLQAHKNISQGRKRDSRRHSTAGFSEKVVHVVAKGGYQFLELFSFCRRERA